MICKIMVCLYWYNLDTFSRSGWRALRDVVCPCLLCTLYTTNVYTTTLEF